MKDIRKTKEQQIRELQNALQASLAENARLKASLDYMSMMSGIDLPANEEAGDVQASDSQESL